MEINRRVANELTLTHIRLNTITGPIPYTVDTVSYRMGSYVDEGDVVSFMEMDVELKVSNPWVRGLARVLEENDILYAIAPLGEFDTKFSIYFRLKE